MLTKYMEMTLARIFNTWKPSSTDVVDWGKVEAYLQTLDDEEKKSLSIFDAINKHLITRDDGVGGKLGIGMDVEMKVLDDAQKESKVKYNLVMTAMALYLLLVSYLAFYLAFYLVQNYFDDGELCRDAVGLGKEGKYYGEVEIDEVLAEILKLSNNGTYGLDYWTTRNGTILI